jgi:hypothetical protein
MRIRPHFASCAILTIAGIGAAAQTFQPEIPRAWDDKEVQLLELPLVQRDRSPRYVTAEQYYALKVRPIYRSYPAYVKGREPAGYLESLKQKEPEIIFDASKLHTKEDWIQAGKLVFESETLFFPAPESQPSASDTSWPVSSDGVLPYFVPGFRYYVRKKGVVEVGADACAGCHTRVMPDGSFVEGAQGSVDKPVTEAKLRAIYEKNPDRLRRIPDTLWIRFGAPWVMSKQAFEESLTKDEIIRQLAAQHPGVLARQGTSLSHPPHIPSLIGIDDIKYLDATGLVRHRSIGDIIAIRHHQRGTGYAGILWGFPTQSACNGL